MAVGLSGYGRRIPDGRVGGRPALRMCLIYNENKRPNDNDGQLSFHETVPSPVASLWWGFLWAIQKMRSARSILPLSSISSIGYMFVPMVFMSVLRATIKSFGDVSKADARVTEIDALAVRDAL